ncbi:MAG: SUMF1/EgtB/PvdO family nonheme iron enzyme [Lewinellaceae bacterium]|nr:SUMF1/EgtB/PvdO family nonheme iron enzyme [Lewinellaceae bacterium]
MQDVLYRQPLPYALSFDMILVEGGAFRMGDDDSEEALDREQPTHQVVLESFHIYQYPLLRYMGMGNGRITTLPLSKAANARWKTYPGRCTGTL